MTFTIDGVSLADRHLTREVTELVHITAPELLAQHPPRRRLGARIAVAAAVLIGAAALAMLASAHAFAAPTADISTSPAAKAQHACAVVLGLDPSQAPYQDCVASLARNLPKAAPQALASMDRPVLTTRQRADLACADAGLDPTSSAFGRCALDVDQSLSDQTQIYR